MHVRGWAIDPDALTSPVTIHLYVGGQAGDPAAEGFDLGPANVYRPDVGAAYPGAGDYHGFDKDVFTGKRGSQPACAYAIDLQGTAGNPLLGCFTVVIAEPDQTPPAVTVKSPTDGSFGNPITTNVTATFSEPVQGVSDTAFQLQPYGASTMLPATVTYDAATLTATLDPTAALKPDTLYSTILWGGEITDLSGNPMGPVFWTFTTGPAPFVTTMTPAPDADDVPVGTTVTATFNERVLGVNENTFELKNSAGAVVEAAVSYDAQARRAILDPGAALAPGETYTATLTGGTAAIRDRAGNPLATSAWSFTTTADAVAPTVRARVPAKGATGVDRDVDVVVTFSEPVTGVREGTFRLKNVATGEVVDAVVTHGAKRNKWILNPVARLGSRKRYTVTLTGGSSAIRDLAGNPLASGSWSFTTKS